MSKSVNDAEIMAVVNKVSEILMEAKFDRTTSINVLDLSLALVMATSNLSDDQAADFLEKNTELIVALMRHRRRAWNKHQEVH